MIGKVISSEHSSFVFEVAKSVNDLKIGDWVLVKGKRAIIQDFKYGKNSALFAVGEYLKNDVTWSPPPAIASRVHFLNSFSRNRSAHLIKSGLISSGKNSFSVGLHPDYVLGPEGSHLNITGISGLATKTSFSMSLIRDIMQNAEAGTLSATSFIFNLKFTDLMHIDQPAVITDHDRKLHTYLGSNILPFKNVKYFAAQSSISLNRPDVTPVEYSINNGLHLLKHLVSVADTGSKLLTSLAETLQSERLLSPEEFGPYSSWKSIWTEPPLCEDGKRPNSWNNFAMGTVKRFVRHLRSVLQEQNTGLFSYVDHSAATDKQSTTFDKIVKTALPGETIVIDMARMTPTEQYFSFNEVLSAIRRNVDSTHRTLADKVVIFVDELNKFAGKEGGTNPVRSLLIDLAERGRSNGLSLFGAQQYISHVHPRIISNCSTRVIGKISPDEMGKPEFSFLNKHQKKWLYAIPKGELILYNAKLGQPLKIRFPKPAFKIGNS